MHVEFRTVPIFSADLLLPARSHQHSRSCVVTNVAHLLEVADVFFSLSSTDCLIFDVTN